MSLEHTDFIGYIPLHQIPTKHSIYIHTIIPQSLYISPASPAVDKFKDPHDPQQAKSKRRYKIENATGATTGRTSAKASQQAKHSIRV
jgi:hypothetical protein